LRELSSEIATDAEGQADESWLWKGRHAKLVDGFTFTMPDTEKNQAEFPHPRTQARRTGRTSKTPKGARRRSVLLSVFESLKLHLSTFTLKAVQAEVAQWSENGESLFDRLRNAAGLDPPGDSRLARLVPDP